MKIFFIILVSFVVFGQLISLEFSEIDNSFQVTGSFEIEEIKTEMTESNSFNKIIISDCKNSIISNTFELPIFSRLVSLPPTGNYKSTNIEYDYDELVLSNKIALVEYNEQEAIYNRDEWFPQDIVTIAKPAIMRGNRFSQISISPIQYNPKQNRIRVLKDIDITFDIDLSENRNPLLKETDSSHFNKIASEKILGANSRISSTGGEYLFIAPSSVESILQPLLRWKEKLGFKTKLVFLDDIGTTADEVKTYLQNAYDTWENPPEFVILVGDVSGAIQCPAFYVEGYWTPWDVSDHNYTLLEGEDYFPDIFIGRLSVQSNMELMTIVSKIINYERNPSMETAWQKRALMVGFVHEWNGYSQRETLMGIRNKLLDFEYAVVDTFINPWQQGQVMLANEISEGESFICYRGTGSPSMWGGFPGVMFTNDNIDLLTNGFMLPLVTSMTCGGGDFASEQFSTCFGEKWVSNGSPSNPNGAIGFIGPSEYDTKTWFNNANAAGIYQGVTQEGLFRCGEMLLRGKMELYNNFPNNHAWGGSLDSDQFYFYVYNLLGDPGLQIQTDIPEEITMSFDQQIPNTENFIEVQIDVLESDKQGFTIALTNSDSLVATAQTDENGIAILPIDQQSSEYEVTASKFNYIPLSQDLGITQWGMLRLSDASFDSPLISNSEVTLNFTFTNISIALDDLTISIDCDNEYITFPSPTIYVDELAYGDNFSGDFDVNISSFWQDAAQVNFILSVTGNPNDEFLYQSEIQSPELIFSNLQVQNFSQCLIQNQTVDISIELMNYGNIETGDFQAELICINGNAEIEQAFVDYTNIQQNGTGIGEGFFSVTPEDVNSGELAQFELIITNDNTILQNINFDFPIGIIDSTSLTFSESGYYAIESGDVGNFSAPLYNWIEIDPTYAGVGPAGMIAPFWDNLFDGRIYVKYDEDNNYFIIQWSDFKNEFDESSEIFQVILYDPEFYFSNNENKLMKFQYKEISNTDQDFNYATVG